ncbi:uncharacterized protein BP5553_04505 [Venustampulla echinocandica]|uniref:Uncharacterized protein n=1 Tax=Venustampulla echinocandica TaxID=2656787 RepID=A0A370TNH7_9HELO|nr:uncharacterized protein BP5553_04505 [Venustampulla echinocandica]RDL37072.1 hypothetical protein BP5553_04505 [Venustampulla echinocandica]
MDAKNPFPPPSSEPDAPPPSYSEIGSPSSGSSSYYSSQINSQLASLTTQISTQQTQATLLSHAHSEHVLSLLTYEIQDYLSTFARSGRRRGTLILIPAAGVTDEKAVPAAFDCSNPDEGTCDVVVRVKGKGDADEMWYWRDEEMAERLAACLRPPPPPPSERGLPPRKEQVAQQQQPQQSTRGLWGRAKSAVKTAAMNEMGNYEVGRDVKTAPPGPREDKVIMDVKAEEVLFRTENDFGIFGSETGWGIVVRLKVIRGGP